MKRADWIAIGGIVVSVLVTTIGSASYLGYKLGTLTEKVTSMAEDISGIKTEIVEIRGDISDIRGDLKEIQVKLDILWKRHLDQAYTPIKPDKSLMDALKKSKIGKFADQHYTEILAQVKSLEPENAAQAQEVLISVVGRLKKSSAYKARLFEAAHQSKQDVDSLLFAMALSISDRVNRDLGFAE